MKTNEIKKGMKIRTNQLGVLIDGVMEDNLRGNTRLIYTKAETIGLYNEYGSVYAHNIIEVYDENNDKWLKVEHTEKQKAFKVKSYYGSMF